MDNKTGYLTVFSADRAEVYGEFADATWRVENTEGGTNHVFAGTAGEGALDTFRRLNAEGIAHVAYLFESNGYRYGGSAQLLAPVVGERSASILIETGDAPARV